VPVERVERGAELLLRRHVDVGGHAVRAAAAARDGAGRLLVPTAAAETGGGDEDPVARTFRCSS